MSIPKGENLDVVATVVDQDGDPLEGRQVKFDLGGLEKTKLTNSEGRASAYFTTSGAHPGHYILAAIITKHDTDEEGKYTGEYTKEQVDWKYVTVFDIEIDSLSPFPLVLGYGALTISYTIKPESSFAADKLSEMIQAKDGKIARKYTTSDPNKTQGGSYSAEWDGKRKESPNLGLYVNANNNPYGVLIWIKKGERIASDEKNFSVEAKAVSASSFEGYGWDAGVKKPKIQALGYSDCVARNGFILSQAQSDSQNRLVWYLLAHGAGGKVLLSDDHLLEPNDLPSGLNYTLVFMNACDSAKGVAHAFADKFGSKAYVGWDGQRPKVGVAAGFADRFFENLRNYTTVQEAIDNAHNAYTIEYNPKAVKGAEVIVELP